MKYTTFVILFIVGLILQYVLNAKAYSTNLTVADNTSSSDNSFIANSTSSFTIGSENFTGDAGNSTNSTDIFYAIDIIVEIYDEEGMCAPFGEDVSL